MADSVLDSGSDLDSGLGSGLDSDSGLVSSSDSSAASEGNQVLWRILKPVNGYVYGAMLLTGLGSVATIATLLLLAVVVSILLNGAANTLVFMGLDWTLQATLMTVMVVGAMAFCLSVLGFGLSHRGAFKLEVELRSRLAQHIADLPLGYVISSGTGSLKKVILEDVKNLHVFVADSTPTFGRIIAAPLVCVIMMFVIDWRLALLAIGLLLIGMVMMSLATKDSHAMQQEYNTQLGLINSAVIEFIQAMNVVRTFDDGSSSFNRYHDALGSFRRIFINWVESTSTSARFAMMVLAPLPTLAVVLAGGIYFMQAGTLSFAELMAMLFIATGMVDAFMPIMWLSNFIRRSKAAANRIDEVFAVPPMPFSANGKKPTELTVEFHQVDFCYEHRNQNALSKVSFVALPGTSTALVGPSGAGKSTVAKLLPRFWDIQHGAITIGGVDIREMSNDDLMDTVTFVFQDTYLFNDSLKNNIKMAKPDASDAQVVAAAKAAQIHDFIESLPDGYHTQAGDRGNRLSGGQRQRITIARAILRNAPIVVLDEATAFADPESEEQIIQAIAHLTQNKTVITIAHRLSTITHVDQILVFDQGRIVESGTHAQLVRSNALYAGLWANYEQPQSWDLHAKGVAHAK